MARRFLGDDFDLHAGGTDLIFPHHENEIAQSESATGSRFARYWLHNGMVNLNGAKMAKSTGNVVGLEEALDTYGGMPLRLLFLRAHYRAPIEFSPELVEEASEAFRRIERLLERIPETDAEPAEWVLARFEEAMDDDFGTPEAVAVLFDAVREANRLLDEGKDAAPLVAAVHEVVAVLGLDGDDRVGSDGIDERAVRDLAGRLGVEAAGPIEQMLDQLLEARAKARRERDFATADAVRDELAAAGVVVEDTPDGARWLRG